MRVAFDSVILGAYLHPDAAYPKPVDRVPERLRHFVETLDADRQIVAIAKVHGVDELYSDDDDVRRLAEADGVAVRGIADLPLPPVDPQPHLFPDPAPGPDGANRTES